MKNSDKSLFLFNLIIFFLIGSCKYSTTSQVKLDTRVIPEKKTINIDDLLNALLNEDKNLTPVLEVLPNGQKSYKYPLLEENRKLKINEIEKWYSEGTNYFTKDRINIKKLLKKLHKLEVNTQIVNIENGVLGLWIPARNQLLIDKKVIKMGSRIFLDVLKHESIHVSQSCFSGSKNNYPKRIGLPLEFSKKINLNLSHKFYSNNSEEAILVEREAFTYSKVEGAAIKLLDKFCF